MMEKVGRNDPCPCGSGKKYKQCCMTRQAPKRKFTAKWIGAPAKAQEAPPARVNLMERVFGGSIEAAERAGKPPAPKTPLPEVPEENQTENY
jgi:uncharacterized protein